MSYKVVTVITHIWDARTKLQPEDIGLNEAPPKEVAGLGSKYRFDRSQLTPMHSARSALYRALRQIGLPLGGGVWLVEDGLFRKKEKKLNECLAAFDRERDSLLANLPTLYEEWYTNLSKSYKDIPYQPAEAQAQLQRSRMRMVTINVDRVPDNQKSGLANLLREEIKEEASRLYQKLKEKNATRRALAPVTRLAEKIRSLAFLDKSDYWTQPLEELDEAMEKAQSNSVHFSTSKFFITRQLTSIIGLAIVEVMPDAPADLDSSTPAEQPEQTSDCKALVRVGALAQLPAPSPSEPESESGAKAIVAEADEKDSSEEGDRTEAEQAEVQRVSKPPAMCVFG